MARKLIDAARILRSKNAGPLYVTFDVMFDSPEDLDAILGSGAVSQAVIADLYQVGIEDVLIIPYQVVNSFKITIPRKHTSGDLHDDDIYGCQQHMKLANILVP
ncbi:MAG: DUF4387 domain-containing protein [Spirochaetales bacterium]|jgi:hypothetical protein|nr:DUF4387 domain-containing protein [Spirochaetales bacterium]